MAHKCAHIIRFCIQTAGLLAPADNDRLTEGNRQKTIQPWNDSDTSGMLYVATLGLMVHISTYTYMI